MIHRMTKMISAGLFFIILIGCHSNAQNLNIQYHDYASLSGLHDFGDKNLPAFKQKLKVTKTRSHTPPVIITQMGDSHTAADYFSGQLRVLLQQRFGNAGIGWVPPMTVSGQYHTSIKWRNTGWELTNSRNAEAAFPMGGFIAKATKEKNEIEYIPTIPFNSNELWNVTLKVKSPTRTPKIKILNSQKQIVKVDSSAIKQNSWSSLTFKTTLPFILTSLDEEIEIGGTWLERNGRSGVILSAVGTNGAQLTIMDKWGQGWQQQLSEINSDMVILAYGTNEAFNPQFNATQYQSDLKSKIRMIRKVSPKAVILLLSPPDTIVDDDSNLSCKNRLPIHYAQIKKIQLNVAKSERTLYWDWQNAMGGACSIEAWTEEGLARSDNVHLTRKGYEKTAEYFYQDLLKKIQ